MTGTFLRPTPVLQSYATLYFRDTNLVKLKENEYIKEVNNWGDVYRVLKKEENKDAKF